MSLAAEDKTRTADAEPDRLEGFSAPREVERLIGHETAIAEFMAARESGRMHHAWLLSGPEGIGKATLAYRFAREMLVDAAAPGSKQATARKVAALSHPNLFLLRRAWNEKTKRYGQWITVDEVRRLRAFLANSAGAAGFRVVIVDRADELNQNAANALLKTLEEPPPKTLFLLISAAEGRLPVTIRSRCRALAINALSPENLRVAVEAALARDVHEIEQEALVRALALSGGSVRRALALATGEGIELYNELVTIMTNLPALDGLRLHRLADRLAGTANTDRAELFFSLLLELIERLVRFASTGEGATAEERALAGKFRLAERQAAWAGAWEQIGQAKADAFALNLDRALLLMETMLLLQRLAGGQKS